MGRQLFVFQSFIGFLVLAGLAGICLPELLISSRVRSVCMAEARLRKGGLVPVSELKGKILTDLRYSGRQNFLGYDVYGCLDKAFVQPEVSVMLEKAARQLKSHRPDLHLLVLDAARPRWAQKILWDKIPGPPSRKRVYVSDPARGSIHNYGAAVDLTLADSSGKELDMGTPFDFFGLLAQPRCEGRFEKEGKLTLSQLENRRLLRKVMTTAGFLPITSEWWHFNAMSLAAAKRRYKILE